MLKTCSILGQLFASVKTICKITMLVCEHTPLSFLFLFFFFLAGCMLSLVYSPYFLIFSFLWPHKVEERECSRDTFVLTSTQQCVLKMISSRENKFQIITDTAQPYAYTRGLGTSFSLMSCKHLFNLSMVTLHQHRYFSLYGSFLSVYECQLQSSLPTFFPSAHVFLFISPFILCDTLN